MHENDPALHHLVSLADPDIPPDLWTKLDSRRARRVRTRRTAAAAFGAVAILAIALPWLPRGPVHDDAAPALVEATAPTDALRSIDRDLQLAYEQGAPEEEIRALWALRRATVADSDPSTHPIRI